jgi:hypothetical protein
MIGDVEIIDVMYDIEDLECIDDFEDIHERGHP